MRRMTVVPLLLVLTVVLSLIGVLAPRLAAQEATPTADDAAAMHAAFAQAVQASDPDAFAALFAPEGVLVTPFGVFQGPEEIGAFFAGLIESNPGLTQTTSEPTVVLNTAVSRDLVAADTFRAAGAERIVIIHTLVVANGQIVALTAIPDPDDPATMQVFAAMAAAAATPAS
jgi:uncharacterized protein (TIGR02246 family)